MNLRNLKYFCAAYEAGSMVAAAAQCHVTQPVISSAVAQLEEELGVRLFVRQARGLSPTAQATRLYRLGGKLLADTEAIVESFQEGRHKPRLSLRVQATIGLAAVQGLLALWQRELGPIDIHLLDDPSQPCDLELVAQGCPQQGPAFTPLWEEAFVLIVPPKHPLAVQEVVSLKDLHGVALVERTQCELAPHWQAGTQALHIVPDVRARVHSEEWTIGLVAAGVGVSLVPQAAVARRDDVVVRADVAELQGFKRVVGLAHAHRPQGVAAQALALSAAPTMAGFMQGAVSSVG